MCFLYGRTMYMFLFCCKFYVIITGNIQAKYLLISVTKLLIKDNKL